MRSSHLNGTQSRVLLLQKRDPTADRNEADATDGEGPREVAHVAMFELHYRR